jgi:hypothetical protein
MFNLKNIVPACLQNTSSLTSASRLFMQNLHPAGRQLDANFIRLVASLMQTVDLGILYCKAATRMQFASSWQLTE